MSKLQVLTVPHPALRKTTKEVTHVDGDIRKMLEDMVETLYAQEAVGLAANQVNIPYRLVVIDYNLYAKEHNKEHNESRPEKTLYKMINPKIVWRDSAKKDFTEGCLSIPGHYPLINRPQSVTVDYLDEDGKAQTITCEDRLASCVQHEIDHLNGILFLDHLGSFKRQTIMRKFTGSAGPSLRI